MIKLILAFASGLLTASLFFLYALTLIAPVEPLQTNTDTLYVGVNYGQQAVAQSRYIQNAPGYQVGGQLQRTQHSAGTQGSW